MRRYFLPAIALAAFAAPVAAQEAAAPETDDQALADLSDRMADPENQREAALMLQAMTEVLLDIPIAPLAQAAADMAGEKAKEIDPDLTLRKLAPDAGRLSEEVARNTPRTMEAIGAMAEGLAAAAPALKDMLARMRESLPPGN